MRLTRRAALRLGGAGALGLLTPRSGFAEKDEGAGRTAITVEAKPIAAFYSREPERRQFGRLTFRSGLVLSAEPASFGGWSGVWRSPEGQQLVAISDRPKWLTASVRYESGRLAGLSDAYMAPMLGESGNALTRSGGYDTESLAIVDGVAYVGLERANEVRRFDWGRDGVKAFGVPIQVPPELKQLPRNEGLEALAVAPANHPLAGSVIAIAERSREGDDAPTRGWVLTGARPFVFDLVRSEGFDITDLTFLPSGEALLLERRFRLVSGGACRIRRIAPDAFTPDAAVNGEVIFEADRGYEIDNMEGIVTHRDPGSGETIVTLMSDNNFSFLQRTLLLEFSLSERRLD